ncbi:hypothetical protein LQZ18_04080, partial [Lachnospiraceae bacterium ZAX-1]
MEGKILKFLQTVACIKKGAEVKKLIYSIFDNTKVDIPQIDVAEGNITKEIESLLKPLKGRLTVEQYEEIRSPLF